MIMSFTPNNFCGPGPPSNISNEVNKTAISVINTKNSNPLTKPNEKDSSTIVYQSSDRLVMGPSCKALRTAVSTLYSADDFHQKTKIGSGFFSEVFKVTHRTTGEVMVLKMNQLRSNRPNMLKEVQLLNKLTHPNILKFMGVCVEEGQLHALTEYIPSGSLEQLIQNKAEYLSPLSKIQIALGIAKGMRYVHSNGVFHRDLTSKNVLVRKYSNGDIDAVVGDFGLAAKIPKKCGKSRLYTVGSPYWMSPECINGLFYDESSDVFSFGIILCELIARIDADPDILPRTDAFGLDYIAFADLCPNDTIPAFLRIAFNCCNYDARSRYTFGDVVKKLTLINDEDSTNSISPSSLNEINLSVAWTSKRAETQSRKFSKRNSVDSTICSNSRDCSLQSTPPYNHSISENRQLDSNKKLSTPPTTFRRSYSSENISLHTVPADKARCHPLNRSNTNNNDEVQQQQNESEITEKSDQLRKIAETMLLKDPKYKPRPKETSKSNPFTTLAQLRGVKKIIGANNPQHLTGGTNDLFSSCFEMSSPFLKNLKEFNHSKTKQAISEPKSLPSSPLIKRKDFIGNCLLPYDNVSSLNTDNSKCYTSTYSNSNNNNNNTKKYFDNLQNHPLYKNGKQDETDLCSNSTDNSKLLISYTATDSCESNAIPLKNSIDTVALNPSKKSANASPEENRPIDSLGATKASLYETPKLLTRRGSTESGFFSCLNEDFCDKTRDLDTVNSYFCACCLISSTPSAKKEENSNDSTTSISLRSLDDLDLTEPAKQSQKFYCSVHNRYDINAKSIDMDLINRLTLDTEINSIIQKHQLSNQLFHCKNRTSSIYSDSNDSLADSLWDDRSYSIPNTRSAQIAKIVEYFERKGSNFASTSNFSMSGLKTSSNLFPNYHHYHHHRQLTDYFVDLQRDFPDIGANNPNSSIALKRDYEAFCFDFSERKSSQNFHKICEGSVKSKLPLFDKQKQQQQQNQNNSDSK